MNAGVCAGAGNVIYWHKNRCVKQKDLCQRWERILVRSTNRLLVGSHEYACKKQHYLVITQAAGHHVSTVYSFQHQLTGQSELFAVPPCPPLSFDLFLPPAACSVVPFSPLFHPFSVAVIYINSGERGGEWGKQVGSMNEESQVSGCCNFYLHQPGNSVGSPLNQMHRCPGNS